MDEIKAANESFLGKLQNLSRTNTGEDGQDEEKIENYFALNDQYVEEEDVKEMEDHTSGSTPPVAHIAVNNIKGLKIPWGNCRGGNILLTSFKFSFPLMTLTNMLSMWFFGDIKKIILTECFGAKM